MTPGTNLFEVNGSSSRVPNDMTIEIVDKLIKKGEQNDSGNTCIFK